MSDRVVNYVDVCVSDNFLTFYIIIMQLNMEIKLMVVDLPDKNELNYVYVLKIYE